LSAAVLLRKAERGVEFSVSPVAARRDGVALVEQGRDLV
jgi:hypothetical protein